MTPPARGRPRLLLLQGGRTGSGDGQPDQTVGSAPAGPAALPPLQPPLLVRPIDATCADDVLLFDARGNLLLAASVKREGALDQLVRAAHALHVLARTAQTIRAGLQVCAASDADPDPSGVLARLIDLIDATTR